MSRDEWKRLMMELSYEALDVPFIGDVTPLLRGAIIDHMERVADRIRETIPSPQNMEAWGWTLCPKLTSKKEREEA